jgi:succinyl-diaminopimelate desuccinylase
VDIQSGIGAANVTPATLNARFNFRYSTEWEHEGLQRKVHEVFNAHEIDYELNWHLSGKPFLTRPGKLIDATRQTIEEIIGTTPELSTGGGTSDGRFISPAGVDVIELGPVNASIHKIDEHVSADDVIKLSEMYQRISELMLLEQ